MVIENTAGGLRIATAEMRSDGNWSTGATDNNFTAFTGNRTLIDGVDASGQHQLTMVMKFVDGADNDVLDFYLDGALIGQSTSFENYWDAVGGDHAANAEANQINRLFFRASAGGAPTDGPDGENQGFLFDDVKYSVFNSDGPDATGNELANSITGNSADNTLLGLGGDDSLFGGLGDDILNGGQGYDILTGGEGADTFVFDADALSDALGGDIQDLIADYDILEGDVVDLSALLGEDTVPNTGAGYVKMDVTRTILEVDADGGGDEYVAIAQFDTPLGAEALKILVDDDTGATVII